MPSFLPGFALFAAAGLIAAAGPTIIHLLNRRRFRVINWAAMDFLLEAMQRNRRIMQLRDILLLLLRTAAVALFGLALARPFFTTAAGDFDPNQPIHAVLVVDNSLSMGYRVLNDSLLDEAKQRANEFIAALPDRSRISVIPLCGAEGGFSRDPYRTKEDAQSALDKIQLMDRRGTAAHAADLALQAIALSPDIPSSAKRVVLFSDQQQSNWPTGDLAEQFKDIPEMQVVEISGSHSESAAVDNSWIADLTVQDGVADVESPTTFIVQVRHEGTNPRPDVLVTLTVDGATTSKKVDLQPGQTSEVVFKHRFDDSRVSGLINQVPAHVSLPPDRLPEDDARYLSVPVVASLPVVFVDQYGDEEDPKRDRYGESFHLRRLLAPKISRTDIAPQLVKIRHLRINQLDREKLRDARLVVIAGVAKPEGAVELLRDYVKQGGQLLIAAGGEFDAAVWNEQAWLDGDGILPVPLAAAAVGQSLEEATGQLQPFFLNFATMSHGYFQLPETSREDHERLFTVGGETGWRPVFFKAVAADMSRPTIDKMLAAERQRITTARGFLAEASDRETKWAEQERAGKLDSAAQQLREADETKRQLIAPNWLSWHAESASATNGANDNAGDSGANTFASTGNASNGPSVTNPNSKIDDLLERTRPRMLAAFTNDHPYMVERNLGHGQVLLVTSGVFSSWNMIPKTDVMFVFDRILRSMIERTLPSRNFGSTEPVLLPVTSDRLAAFTLRRPDGREEPLNVDALGGDEYGVAIRNVGQRGIYTVLMQRSLSSDAAIAGAPIEIPLAVNGPAEESELAVLTKETFEERIRDSANSQSAGGQPAGSAAVATKFRWVARGETIGIEGAQIWGQNLWWWLALTILICLLAELVILAWPMLMAQLRARADADEQSVDPITT